MLPAAPQKQNQTPSQSKKSEGFFFQPKLTINQPNDVYEQEADAVANKVMRMPETSPSLAGNKPFFSPPTVNINKANTAKEEPLKKEIEEEQTEESIPEIQAKLSFDGLPPPPDDNKENNTTLIQRKCAHCEEEENKIQRNEINSSEVVADTSTENYIGSLNGKGRSLTQGERKFFEPRMGYDFSNVQLHTYSGANESAKSINALAYTHGNNVVFGSGQYQPNTEDGKRLLAHELTHVVQQQSKSGSLQRFNQTGGQSGQSFWTRGGMFSNSGSFISGKPSFFQQTPDPGIIMRQVSGTPQAPVRLATVAEAAEFLEDMVRFLQGSRQFAATLLQLEHGRPASLAQRRHAHGVLNQKKLRELLANARTAFAAQSTALESGDPASTRLRAAFLDVIMKIREAAQEAIAISDAMSAAERDAERILNVQLFTELIEADPFTSAGMLGTPAFGPSEAAAGASHEAFINSYLDDLIRTLPGQSLAPAARDQILARIAAGLRRAFLTVNTGPSGNLNLQAITNPVTVEKYLRVVELLGAAMSSRPPQLSVITDSPPAYVLPPDPVPDVTQQLSHSTSIGVADFSHVPPGELPYVRFGVFQVSNTVFAAPSTNQFRNASWTVVLQVRRGGNIVRVRYDLIFDVSGNVRIERIGEAAPREVAPAFAQLSVPGKKAQLIADFGLLAVDDRPAAHGRPAAIWTPAELDQVKAVYDLFPARDRAALQGVTIVREHHGPPLAHGQTLEGFAHTGVDPAHDAPAPPPHAPPHIHYYDDAFNQNALTGIGAPGSSGPGADWTIAHEVGHARIFLALRQANVAVQAANQLSTRATAAVNTAIRAASLSSTQRPVLTSYLRAVTSSNNAIHALNAAVTATPPATPAQRAQLLQTAQAAVVARNTAHANLIAAGVPAGLAQAATNLDAAGDAELAATISIGAAQDQIPTFTALAGTFGFTPFTDYGRREGPAEWFAETYALFITDPARLSQINRSIFLWFQAGMPMNPAWRPVP